MTYSISVNGSMQNLDDESTIEKKARDFVSQLDGVSNATLVTTHGGSFNLTTPAESNSNEE